MDARAQLQNLEVWRAASRARSGRYMWNRDPMRLEALDRMTRALEAAKAAKDRGLDLRPVREILSEARKAFGTRDYRRAIDLATRSMEMCGVTLPP